MDLCAGLTVIRHIGLLGTSLRYTSRIRNTGVVYFILIVDRTEYICHIVYNLLHVMLDVNFIIIWTSDCYVGEVGACPHS